ncbi:MAG: hypothetical protein CMM50_18660 [Rhodospirillaceae bacterium]|nr:hypothetical protein [Rhodospirillaceae bacterium]
MIGRLDARVTLQTVERTADGEGGFSESWSDAATLWARVRPVAAPLEVSGAQPRHPATIRVTLRHGATVDCGMRLVHEGTAYRIVDGPTADEDRRWITLVCQAL